MGILACKLFQVAQLQFQGQKYMASCNAGIIVQGNEEGQPSLPALIYT